MLIVDNELKLPTDQDLQNSGSMGEFSESTEEELSSLEAIYSDEIKIKRCFQCSEQGQTPWIADIVYKLTPAVVDEARDEITVQVKIPPRYPEVPAKVEAVGTCKDIQLLTQELQQFSEQNVGTQILYTLFERAREWIDQQQTEENESTQTTDEQEEIPLCKFFQQGKCRFGDKCRNRHQQLGHSPQATVKESSLHDQIQARGKDDRSVRSKSETSEASRNPKNDADSLSSNGKKAVLSKDKHAVAFKETKQTKSGSDVEVAKDSKKKSMKTATDVISRIMWDETLPTEDFLVGYLDRFIGIVEKPFTAFSWEDIASVDYSVLAIPKHRIQYFKYKDVIVWDKTTRTDKVFGSTGDQENVMDIIEADLMKPKETECLTEAQSSTQATGEDVSDSEDDDTDSHDLKQRKDDGNRPNYFISFRVTDQRIRAETKKVQDYIVSCDDRLEEGCLKTKELHVTLCMLRLENDEDKTKALQVLQTVQPILVCMLPSTQSLTFNKLGNFRGRVLHVEINNDPVLSKFVNILMLKLKDAGVKLAGNYDTYSPHMTVLKLSRPMCRIMKTSLLSPAYYLQFQNQYFGEQSLNKIHLCSTSKDRGDDGFYIELGSVVNSLACVSDRLPELIALNVQGLVKSGSFTQDEGDELLGGILSSDPEEFEFAAVALAKALESKGINEFSKKVVIVRGLPGTGKSYFLEHCTESQAQGQSMVVCSADDYFNDLPGGYSFNPSAISKAHAYCRQKFIKAIQGNVDIIAVDNTNSQLWEYQIYKRIASLVGYEFHVIELACKDEEAIRNAVKRCKHNVTFDTIHMMWKRWEHDPEAAVIESVFDDPEIDISVKEIIQKKSNHSLVVDRKGILYSALYLDETSRNQLLGVFPPQHKNVTANHMTLCYGLLNEQIKHIPVGKRHSVKVTGYVCNDLVQVVAVDEIDNVLCSMPIPHITISNSKKAAPRHASEALEDNTHWQLSSKPITLTGTVGVQVAISEKDSRSVLDYSTFVDVCKQIGIKLKTKRSKEKKLSESCSEMLSYDTNDQGADAGMYFGPDRIESLFVFDFDGTLFMTPDAVEGRRIYHRVTGKHWPHKGWIARPESLKYPLQSFPGPALTDFKSYAGRACSQTIVLTGRIERTSSGVHSVLDEFGVHPDQLYLKPDLDNEASHQRVSVPKFKRKVIDDILTKNKGIKLVKVWDDREDNFNALEGLRTKFGNVKFEFSKVSEESLPSDKKVKSWDESDLLEFLKKHGLIADPVLKQATVEGIHFIVNAWSAVLQIEAKKAEKYVIPFGSYPLGRKGDVDLCLLAPEALTPSDCVIRMETELQKRGVTYTHAATKNIRCPRLKIKLQYLSAPPVEFDITFATCVPDIKTSGPLDIENWFKNGDRVAKTALEGSVFLNKVSACIDGKISKQRFGALVDLVVLYLKARHLKGNAFHCIRTFHIVGKLAEMIAKSHNVQGSTLESFFKGALKYLAAQESDEFIRVFKDLVPSEYIDVLKEEFGRASELVDNGTSLDDLFSHGAFPPANYLTVSLKVSCANKVLRWRASTYLEARLGSYLRTLLTAGVMVYPGPSDYSDIIQFAMPDEDRSIKLFKDTFKGFEKEFSHIDKSGDLKIVTAMNR